LYKIYNKLKEYENKWVQLYVMVYIYIVYIACPPNGMSIIQNSTKVLLSLHKAKRQQNIELVYQ